MMQVNSLPVKERKISSHHTRWVHRLKNTSDFDLVVFSFILLMAEILLTSWGNGSFSHYLQGFIHPRWCRISEPSTVVGMFIPRKVPGSTIFPSKLQRKEVMQLPKFTHNKITTVIVVLPSLLSSFTMRHYHLCFFCWVKDKSLFKWIEPTPKMSQQVQWSLKKAHNLSGANQHNFQA